MSVTNDLLDLMGTVKDRATFKATLCNIAAMTAYMIDTNGSIDSGDYRAILAEAVNTAEESEKRD